MMTKDENLLESIRLNILFDKGMVFVPFILKGVVSSFDHPEVLLVLFVEGKMCDKSIWKFLGIMTSYLSIVQKRKEREDKVMNVKKSYRDYESVTCFNAMIYM